MTRAQTCIMRLAHDRVDLAGHDRRAGLAVGQHDLVEAAARAGAEPADVVGDGEQADGDGAQLAGALDQAVAVGVGLEVVLGLDERDAGFLGQHLGHLGAELRVRVDAGADRGAARRQLEDRLQRPLGPLDRQLESAGRSR